MINREDFIRKYVVFGSDYVLGEIWTIHNAIDFALRKFMNDNFSGMDPEKIQSMKENFLHDDVWIVKIEQKLHKTYLESCFLLNSYIISNHIQRRIQPEFPLIDIIIRNKGVLVHDSYYYEFTAIEQEDLDAIKKQVQSCLDELNDD